VLRRSEQLAPAVLALQADANPATGKPAVLVGEPEVFALARDGGNLAGGVVGLALGAGSVTGGNTSDGSPRSDRRSEQLAPAVLALQTYANRSTPRAPPACVSSSMGGRGPRSDRTLGHKRHADAPVVPG
jgi:hypothetical protein